MVKRTLIVGTSHLVRKLVTEIGSRAYAGYSVIGLISEAGPAVIATPEIQCPTLGRLEDLQRIVAEHKPDRIIVAMDEQYGYLHADRLVETQVHNHLVVETGVEAYERLTGKLAIESLTPGNVLFSSEFRQSRFALGFARCSSMLVACVGLLCCLPLMGLIALAIRLTSPGPVWFVQERVGLGGRRFQLLKFRSMRVTAEAHSEWARDNSDRITPLGKVLRKFRLDELPQFVNVIRGDMNLVGPRPHPASNGELFTLVSRNTPECGEQIPYYSMRSSVRPGITGWAQVRYKYANGLDEEIEKLRYDLYYIKHYSILLDLRILFETVKVVLSGHESRTEPDMRAPEQQPIGAEQTVREQYLVKGTRIKPGAMPSFGHYRQRSMGNRKLADGNLQNRL